MKLQHQVTCKSITPGNADLTTTIELDLLENAVGNVRLSQGGFPRVLISVVPPALAEKISDTELELHAEADRLFGKVTPKGKSTKVDGGIKTADKPQYDTLRVNCLEAARMIQDARNVLWAAERAEQQREADAAIPAGMVKLTFSHSEADGWIQIYRDAQGRELRSPKIAGERGESAWMAEVDYTAAVAAFDEERAAAQTKTAQREAAQEADVVRLASVEVPVAAVAAYKVCQGDPERLEDEIDNPDYWLVKRYADAIEAQGLAREATGRKFSAEFQAAAREEAIDQ